VRFDHELTGDEYDELNDHDQERYVEWLLARRFPARSPNGVKVYSERQIMSDVEARQVGRRRVHLDPDEEAVDHCVVDTRWASVMDAAKSVGLSWRCLQVLQLRREGYTEKVIGEKLGVSERTIRRWWVICVERLRRCPWFGLWDVMAEELRMRYTDVRAICRSHRWRTRTEGGDP